MRSAAVRSGDQAATARTVSCLDLTKQRRALMVLAYYGRVVMLSPVGSLAVLSRAQVDQLRAALAAAQAERNDAGGR